MLVLPGRTQVKTTQFVSHLDDGTGDAETSIMCAESGPFLTGKRAHLLSASLHTEHPLPIELPTAVWNAAFCVPFDMPALIF